MKSNRCQDWFVSAKQSAGKVMGKQPIQSRSTAFPLRSITPFFPAHPGRNNRHIVYATQSQQFGITRYKAIHSCVQRTGDLDQANNNGFDCNDVFNSSSIGSFEFADGTTLTTAELLARGFDLDGTAGDMILGTNANDRIRWRMDVVTNGGRAANHEALNVWRNAA
jgi:hypothetical protein